MGPSKAYIQEKLTYYFPSLVHKHDNYAHKKRETTNSKSPEPIILFDQSRAIVRLCSALCKDRNLCTYIRVIVKSCPVGPELHSSFDASSTPGCCPQSYEILLNKGMKYWDSGLNERVSTTFIATVHIVAAVISWKRWGKGRRGQTQFKL